MAIKIEKEQRLTRTQNVKRAQPFTMRTSKLHLTMCMEIKYSPKMVIKRACVQERKRNKYNDRETMLQKKRCFLLSVQQYHK